MSVGDRIKAIRERRGYTQKHLAELAGIHDVLLRRYEHGDRNPKDAQLQKIADALEVRINLLKEPVLISDEDIMFALFELEQSRGKVSFEQKGPKIYVNFDDFNLNQKLLEWKSAKETLSDEEYETWKLNYPDDLIHIHKGKVEKVTKGNK